MLNKWRNMPVMVRASVAYTVCSILQKGVSFITLPLFTRMMTTEQFGQYTIYTSWSSILTIFVTLYLAYGCFNTAMTRFDRDRDRYIAAVQGLVTTLAVAFLAIYLPWQSFWNNVFELPTPAVLLLVAEIVANFSLSCWFGKKRYEYRYKPVILVTLMMAVLSPIVAYFLINSYEEKGYARVAGYAAVVVAFGGAVYVRNLLRGKSLYNGKYWRYALSFNVPLIPYYLSQVIFNQIDRLMISRYCGKDKTGIYGVAYSLAIMLNFVLNAINDAYVPWLYRKLKSKNAEENQKISTGIALLMAVLLLGVITLAPEIIRVLGGQKYHEAVWVVPPVAMSVLLLFYSQLFINIQFYYEEKALLVYASVGVALLNVVLNAALIPAFGFVAAAYTTLISYMAFAGSNYIAMKRALKKWDREEKLFHIPNLLLILAVFMAASFGVMALYDYFWLRIAAAVIGIALLALNSKRILALLKMIRSKEES